MTKKKCPACDQLKPLKEFYKSNNKVYARCKKCLCENHKLRWTERKIEAMKLFGSKCCRCGYCRNYAALEFHHLDAKEKDFAWVKLRQLSWDQIIKELKKCILLCANCHREEHWPDAVFEKHEDRKIQSFLNRTNEIKPTGLCPQCGLDVYQTKYCSVKCSSMSKRKAKRPSEEELSWLLKTKTLTAIAHQYRVTGNAVKKWAKAYGIWQPRRDSNPE